MLEPSRSGLLPKIHSHWSVNIPLSNFKGGSRISCWVGGANPRCGEAASDASAFGENVCNKKAVALMAQLSAG